MNRWIGQFSSFLSTTQTKLQTVSLTLDQHMCEVKSISLLFFTNYTVTIFLAVFYRLCSKLGSLIHTSSFSHSMQINSLNFAKIPRVLRLHKNLLVSFTRFDGKWNGKKHVRKWCRFRTLENKNKHVIAFEKIQII